LGNGEWGAKRGDQTRFVPIPEAVAPRVCANCNGGWVSQLEQRAQPLVLALMFSDQPCVDLSPSDQQTLATWAIKTALTTELWHPKQWIAERWYSSFYANQVPSNNCTIWTAAYNSTLVALYSSSTKVEVRSTHSFSSDGVLVEVPASHEGTLYTLRMFRLIVQILFQSDYVPLGRSDDYRVVRQIWPLPNPVLAMAAEPPCYGRPQLCGFHQASRCHAPRGTAE